MRSLAGRLIVVTAAATAGVMVVWGAWLYISMRGALLAQFEESLRSKARAIASMVERAGRRIEFEPDAMALADFSLRLNPQYFQVTLDDGHVLAKSESLGNGFLGVEKLGPGASRPVALPDGRPGRLLAYTFLPHEETSQHTHEPAIPAHVLPEKARPIATIFIARDTEPLDAILGTLAWQVILLGGFAIAVSSVLLALAVRRGLAPVRSLGEQIEQVRERELSRRIDVPDAPSELSPIVQRLNQLLARLEGAFERERAFSADVAHELRTPLAGIRMALEVALSRPRSSEEYAPILARCLAATQQLGRMVENLMLLARAEAGEISIQPQAIDLAGIVQRAWEDLADRAGQRHLTIEWRLPAEANDAVAWSDPDLVRHITVNLLGNAVTYADESGRIEVSVAADGGAPTLVIRNTGCRLLPGDMERVFDRFWRGDAARQTGAGHHGLGLPLCRRLAGVLGAELKVSLPEAGIFEARVELPAARAEGTGEPELAMPAKVGE